MGPRFRVVFGLQSLAVMGGRHGGLHHRRGGQDGGLVGWGRADGLLDREDGLGRRDGAHGGAVLSGGRLRPGLGLTVVLFIIVGILLLPDGGTPEGLEAGGEAVGIGG